METWQTFCDQGPTSGSAYREMRTALAIRPCAWISSAYSGLRTSTPASPLQRTQLRGFATCCVALHSTATIRHSTALALPSRLAPIGWCFGPLTPNTAAFRRRSETQARGLCFQARHMHTCISAAPRGTEMSTLRAMRHVGPCSTRRLEPRRSRKGDQAAISNARPISASLRHTTRQFWQILPCAMLSLNS